MVLTVTFIITAHLNSVWPVPTCVIRSAYSHVYVHTIYMSVLCDTVSSCCSKSIWIQKYKVLWDWWTDHTESLSGMLIHIYRMVYSVSSSHNMNCYLLVMFQNLKQFLIFSYESTFPILVRTSMYLGTIDLAYPSRAVIRMTQ